MSKTNLKPRTATRSSLLVVAFCFLTIIADGYDLIVYGATVPKLLEEPGWGLTPATAGLLGSATLLGLMVGFMTAGPLSDRFGRRLIMVGGTAWFSIGTALCGFADSPTTFGILRFLTGIGLGAVVPSAVALTVEYAPAHRRQLYNGLMLTGYSFGGIISALLAMQLLPVYDWRLMYLLGAGFLMLAPIMWFTLPESAACHLSKGEHEKATRLANRYGVELTTLHDETSLATDGKRGYAQLLSARYRVPAVLFVLAAFCSQLVGYGLSTWLPVLMRKGGYELGSSLQFLLALQVGAILGAVGGSLFADRIGSRKVITCTFLLGTACLALLSFPLGQPALLALVAGAGIGSIGTNMLIYGFIGDFFPTSCRGTAVGMAQGLGRTGAVLGPTVGGILIGANVGFQWNFYVFAAIAAVGALVVLGLPRGRAAVASSSRADQRTTSAPVEEAVPDTV